MWLHLEGISLNASGAVVLAASSLTGRLWSGSLSVFRTCLDANDPEKAVAFGSCEASIADVQWLSQNVVLAASDSGAVELWEVVDGTSQLQLVSMVYEHDASVRCVSVAPSAEPDFFLSGGDDCSISVWRLDSGMPVSERRLKAHTRGVTGLGCVMGSDERLFASCARDDRAMLWDLRQQRPAVALASTSGANCVCWSSDSRVSEMLSSRV